MAIINNFPANGAAGGGMSLAHTLEMVQRTIKADSRLI